MVSAAHTVQNGSAADALVDSQARGYAGNVSPEKAFTFLSCEAGVLVDVRTLPEWQFTGVPDLRGIGQEVMMVSWKTYPQFQLNPDFSKELSQKIPSKDTPIFFICRSGGRSLDAAKAMSAAGYTYCFNVSGGFEGEPDSSGKRCTKEGWKVANLPWSQT
jgi:rhodanese-related sulfurtransferase